MHSAKSAVAEETALDFRTSMPMALADIALSTTCKETSARLSVHTLAATKREGESSCNKKAHLGQVQESKG